MKPLRELNPALNLTAVTDSLSVEGWLQIEDVLTPRSAFKIQSILAGATPWGLAWQAWPDGPHLALEPHKYVLPRPKM